MARPRTGTLFYRKHGWCARVTVVIDGEPAVGIADLDADVAADEIITDGDWADVLDVDSDDFTGRGLGRGLRQQESPKQEEAA